MMQTDTARSKWLPTLLGLLALMLLSVAIRVPFFTMPLQPDEGSYAYVAREWSSDLQIYRDIPFNRTPAVFLMYKAILALLGTDVSAIRLAGALYNALSVAAVFWLAKDVFLRRAAWIAALIYAVASAMPHVEGFTSNLELFTALPLILAAHLTWREKWGWAGFLSGLAFLLKPIGLSGLLLALGWMVVVRPPWRAVAALLAGFAIGPLAVAAHGATIGWDHFWTNFVQQTLLTNSFLGKEIWYQAGSFAVLAIRTAPAWMIAGVLAGVALVASPRRTRWFGALWILSACVGIAMGGGPWRHYVFQIIPTLALLSGAGLLALPRVRRRWFWNALLVLAFVVGIIWELPLWFVSPEEASWQLYQSPPLQLAPEVADYVASATSETDTIYVAFTQAQIYYLAERRAQPFQLFWYEVSNSQRIFDQVVDSIRERNPALIIWVQPPPAARTTFEDFEQLIQAGYDEARRFGSGDPRTDGIIVYQHKAGTP